PPPPRPLPLPLQTAPYTPEEVCVEGPLLPLLTAAGYNQPADLLSLLRRMLLFNPSDRPDLMTAMDGLMAWELAGDRDLCVWKCFCGMYMEEKYPVCHYCTSE
ncbi:MAG: hypothetical protein P4L40_03320, partial [Terracidiphilus sp.]|nr:hypothetical protein [Terracidiphilus sp.]